jgi:two-component system, chemotaxis family, CheB/CheR fusion protein
MNNLDETGRRQELALQSVSSTSEVRDPQQNPSEAEADFLVVGIGASAGGLEAFERFFKNMPPDGNMAFVLTQHLDADHISILPELITRYTRMPVLQVSDNIQVKPNHVYVIPPNHNMALHQGKLSLSEFEAARGNRLPIDFFFYSLAQDQGERAIGIVLSGTGSDGSRGIEAIRAGGGVVIAQEPQSASYDGMPKSAIATGMVDFVLAPEAMPAQLLRFTARDHSAALAGPNHDLEMAKDPLKKIFSMLYTLSRQDFLFYKQSTMLRQIERRMKVNFFSSFEQYARFLEESPQEVQLLFDDLLIGVTSFFRDAEAWQALTEKAIAKIIQRDPENEIPIRVWVPACSTGEEAYSMAILFQEQLEALGSRRKVQIYATDINPHAIEHARAGAYRSSIKADLSEEHLARFFMMEGSSIQVKKNIRDMVVFAVQNLIMDPPFSRMDLISCRNLLIYLEPETQRKVLPLFHYALIKEGFLFLGNAETVSGFGDFFSTIDRRNKIYRKKETSQRPTAEVKFNLSAVGRIQSNDPQREKSVDRMGLPEWTEKVIGEFFSPACVVIDEKFDILYVHGHIGNYLEPPQGESTTNIVKMARGGLKAKLSAAIRKAIRQRTDVQVKRLKYKINGEEQVIQMTVKLFIAAIDDQTLILVVFEEVQSIPFHPGSADNDQPSENTEQRIADLEQELKIKEDFLQTTVSDLEALNQEVKLINEDLLSANEELQSTNEELETSKEELQSINEELVTVNTELQRKNEELSATINDVNNFMASTEIATIFLDLDLQIRRYTPTVNKIFSLLPGDIGRPIQHFVSTLKYDKIIEDAQSVLDTLVPCSVEVQSNNGEWYLMSIKPYRTVEHTVDGLVITLFDITKQKKGEEARRLATLVRDSNDAIVIFDTDGKILDWNLGAFRLYGWNENEALQMNIQRVIPLEKDEEFRTLIQRMAHGEKIDAFETERLTKAGERITIWLTITVLRNDLGKPIGIAATERDITAHRRDERSLKYANRALLSLKHWYRNIIEPSFVENGPAELCRILVENAGYRLAWIGLAKEDETKSVTPIASAGFENQDLDTLQFTWKYSKAGQEPIGKAIRTGQPAVIRKGRTGLPDLTQDGGQQQPSKLGTGSLVAIPIAGKRFASGVLVIYASEPDAFDAQEIDLLAQLVTDLPSMISSFKIPQDH